MPTFHLLYAVLGAVILAYLALDVVWTTLHRGGGPTTRAMVHPLWRLTMRTRHRGLASHRVMSILGVVLVVATVGIWIVLLWLGWTLVFLGAPQAVVGSSPETVATFFERVYFVGFTVFTLGIGDFKPGDTPWQILTAVASMSGFILVTFCVTYLMPVVQAAVMKSAFASRISAFGDSPVELLKACVEEGDTSGLETLVAASANELAEVSHLHDTFPVLHFFHPVDPRSSLSLSVARLDDALRIARLASRDRVCRQGVCTQWSVLVERFVCSVGVPSNHDLDPPPVPKIDSLTNTLPTVSSEAFQRGMDEDREQRARLHSLVRHHGWMWEAVDGGSRERDALPTDHTPAHERVSAASR